jgi:hypothetical protein
MKPKAKKEPKRKTEMVVIPKAKVQKASDVKKVKLSKKAEVSVQKANAVPPAGLKGMSKNEGSVPISSSYQRPVRLEELSLYQETLKKSSTPSTQFARLDRPVDTSEPKGKGKAPIVVANFNQNEYARSSHQVLNPYYSTTKPVEPRNQPIYPPLPVDTSEPKGKGKAPIVVANFNQNEYARSSHQVLNPYYSTTKPVEPRNQPIYPPLDNKIPPALPPRAVNYPTKTISEKPLPQLPPSSAYDKQNSLPNLAEQSYRNDAAKQPQKTWPDLVESQSYRNEIIMNNRPHQTRPEISNFNIDHPSSVGSFYTAPIEGRYASLSESYQYVIDIENSRNPPVSHSAIEIENSINQPLSQDYSRFLDIDQKTSSEPVYHYEIEVPPPYQPNNSYIAVESKVHNESAPILLNAIPIQTENSSFVIVKNNTTDLHVGLVVDVNSSVHGSVAPLSNGPVVIPVEEVETPFIVKQVETPFIVKEVEDKVYDLENDLSNNQKEVEIEVNPNTSQVNNEIPPSIPSSKVSKDHLIIHIDFETEYPQSLDGSSEGINNDTGPLFDFYEDTLLRQTPPRQLREQIRNDVETPETRPLISNHEDLNHVETALEENQDDNF